MNLPILLQRAIAWLSEHKLVNVLLVLAYFAFIIFMHHPMVLLSIWVEKNLSLDTYNLAVAVVFVLLVGAVVWTLLQQLRIYPENRSLKVFYLAATLLVLFIHSRFMLDSNIEVIHSLEFTILAFLLFPLVGRYGAAIFLTLPFMLFDEWYQYVLLYPEWNDYLDLNDVLMDTYGCALIMLVLMICGIKAAGYKPLLKRFEFWGTVSFLVAALLLMKLCVVAPYTFEQCDSTLFVMNERMDAEPFSRRHPTHNINYHVMNPWEGIVAITWLFLFYLGLDGFTAKEVKR